MFIKVWVGNIKDYVEKLLKTICTCKSDQNYPKYALQMYPESGYAMKSTEAILNDWIELNTLFIVSLKIQ